MTTIHHTQDFDTHVKSMIKRHLEPPKKASAEFGTIAGEVSANGFMFFVVEFAAPDVVTRRSEIRGADMKIS